MQQSGTESWSEDELRIEGPFENAFYATEDDPAEAARLTMLADLSIILELHIRKQGWTQKEAAKRLGVTQPRISDLMRGKLSVFSIDSLITLLTTAGIKVELRVKDAA